MSGPATGNVDQKFADSVLKSKEAAEENDTPFSGPPPTVLSAVKSAAETTFQGLKEGATMVKEAVVGGEKSPVEAKRDAEH